MTQLLERQAPTSDSVTLSWMSSPLGPLLAGATADGLCLLEFGDRATMDAQLEAVRKRFARSVVSEENEYLKTLESELASYFAGTLQEFTVSLIYPGTPFQEQVWAELLRIPYGETRSYEDLAIAVDNPKAVRAVGRTNGLNRICIVIPCHRVINKGGKLGGYGGGLRRKEFLLELERKHKSGIA